MGLEDRVNNNLGTLGLNITIDDILFSGEAVGINSEDILKQLQNVQESPEVKQSYLQAVNGIFGKAMNYVMDKAGYPRKMPDHYVYLNLPDTVMGVTIKLSNGKTILGHNAKYAQHFKNNPLAALYVNLHEHGHIRGEKMESYTEGLVKDAARYVREMIQNLYNKYNGKPRNLKILDYLSNLIERYAGQREIAQAGR